MTRTTDRRLGSQIWLEQEDSPERVEHLVATAAEVGIGQLRTFLMWPWIQAQSASEWDFRLFDSLFDAAARHDITIKATLTANSGPWWLGTPSVLHSHTLVLDEDWWGHAAEYISQCATRYGGHPALGQWILWNEPLNPGAFNGSTPARPANCLADWREFLRTSFGDISTLNARWRTGYDSLDSVQLPEEIAHPYHRSSHWRSFGPDLADAQFRARQLEDQLARIAGLVQASDSSTPLCINPSSTLENHALSGYHLGRLADIVDVLGASFHAPWAFTFAQAHDHTSLIVAGLTLLRTSPKAAVEVTELQAGNTFYAGRRALGAPASTIAHSYLAPLLAGAQSVTGWCFNTRSQDFEAGEWGLLDDLDQIGERAQSLARVKDVLHRLDESIGTWTPLPLAAGVLVSERSQAVELGFAEHSATDNQAADPNVGIRGSALVVAQLTKLGIPTGLVTADSLAGQEDHLRLLVAANHIAWDAETADRLLSFAESGGTVLVDGTSGEFDFDARLNRPWPGQLAERVGLRSRGLQTDPTGEPAVSVNLNGSRFSSAANVRSDVELDGATWAPDHRLTYASDSRPVLWERAWGAGRILYSTAPLAHTILRGADGRPLVSYLLERAAELVAPVDCRPLSAETAIFRVHGERGEAVGLFAPPGTQRDSHVTATMAPGDYLDLWTGQPVAVGPDEVFASPAPDGIVLLVGAPSSGR